MNIKIQAIQINQINIYRFSVFPEERIKTLISELNVHYDKINNYIESEICGDAINKEVIDSLAKLNEINRLAPYKINHDFYSGDFRLGIDLLESVIALLKTGAGHEKTKKNLLELGWCLLSKLYDFSFNSLTNSALLYYWLKNHELVRSHSLNRWDRDSKSSNNNRITFNPSESELEEFYSKNKQNIYNHMVFDMNDQKEEQNPFTNQQACDYYHYYLTLDAIEI